MVVSAVKADCDPFGRKVNHCADAKATSQSRVTLDRGTPKRDPMLDHSIDAAGVHEKRGFMCNLYKLKPARSEIIGLFRAADSWHSDMAKDYVSPGLEGPVVVAHDCGRISGLMTWGLPNAGKLVTNVRNLDSPFWRDMLARPRHRCLVPASAFQEWSEKPDPLTKKKQPYWYSIPTRPLFAFAGIWRKVDGQPCFAFLTTEPNSLIAAVHPKAMPVILDEVDYDTWLCGDWSDALRLVSAYPAQLMVAK